MQPATAREGRVRRRIRQALLGYDRPMTTAELAAAAWPRKDMSREPKWRWLDARRKIERLAVRASPRTHPYLTWVARPEVLAGKKG